MVENHGIILVFGIYIYRAETTKFVGEVAVDWRSRKDFLLSALNFQLFLPVAESSCDAALGGM